MVIDEFIALLGWQTTGDAERARFESGMKRISDLAQKMATALVASGTVAATAMAGLGKSVIKTSAEFEGYQTSLETIEGSAEKAKSSMDWITKFAAKTPYELGGITEAFIKLKSYGIDPMDGTLETLGDTASAMNKPLMQAVEAYADATGMQFERLRDFGLRAEQKGNEVTFIWTKNGKEMRKTIRKNGAEVQKFMKDFFGKTFSGAMIRQSKTWNGVMANLSDSWEIFKKGIGDAGFFKHVKSKFAGLLDQIGKLDENGTLGGWQKYLSDGLTSAFDTGWMLAERFVLNIMTIGQLLDKLGGKIGDFLRDISGGNIDLGNWQSLLAVLGVLLALLSPAMAAAVGLALAFDDFLSYLRGGNSHLGRWIKGLKAMGVSFESIGSFVTSLAKVIKTKLANVDWVNLGEDLGRNVIGGIRSAVTNLKNTLSSFDWKAVGSAWLAYVKAEAALVTGFLKGVYQAAMEIDWKAVGNEAKTSLEAAFNSVTQTVKDMGSSVGKSVADWFGVENVGDIGGKITEAIGKVDWGSLGKTAGKSLVDGISNIVSTISDVIKPMLSGIDWSDLGKKIGESVNFKAIGDLWVAAMKAQVQLIVGVWNGVIDGVKALDWGSIWDSIVSIFSARDALIVGIFLGLKDRIVEAIKAWFDIDFNEIGTRIGNGIMAGLQSVGDQIKAWFNSLLPSWASDFFDWKTEKDGPLKAKAKEEGERRRLFEEQTRPRGGNTPGLSDTLDNVRRSGSNVIPTESARKDRSISTEQKAAETTDDSSYAQKVLNALTNFQRNMAKVGGDAARAVTVTDKSNRSITTNTNIALTVQKVQEAAAKAADAASKGVTKAVNGAQNAPRIANTPSF